MSTDQIDPAPGHRPHQTLAGIALLASAVACFACIDASAKWLNRSMPPMQTVTVRYLSSFLISGLLLNPLRKPGIMRTRRPWLQCARAACVVVMSICTYTAFQYLPLTTLTSITFAAPLLVAVLAAPLLGETLGPRRAVAICIGFAGVLVVTRPWSGSFHWAMLLALATAGLNALYALATRVLAAYDPPQTTMFYTGLVGAISVLPIMPFVWHTPTSPQVWVVMGLFGLFGALGHWLLILAHLRAPASVLAPFFYTHLIWATALGAIIFQELPDRWTMIGGAIVMSSGLYLLYRERIRHRQPSVDVSV
ncbi:MAG: DMT family transporter [Opitutus sp.]|nr:DMT family transporter [Opitutus sp.]